MSASIAFDAGTARRPRIEVIGLLKTFKREGGSSITPIDNISLSVGENELVVLLGPSGCGKTTLLRCVAGLERPDEGEIVIDGRTVFSSRKGIYEPADRRELAMVFQSYALWPHMTVAENVAFPLRSRNVPKLQIAQRVADVLKMVGVGGLEGQFPSRISGGQQQRVALARALVANSSVVLFDEPLSNVDAQVRAQLRFELQAMQRRLGFSGLYVTHDQTEAMELGHRVAVLDSGRIAALGTPAEVYNHPPNEYTARFVGVANIWRGQIAGARGNSVDVSTELGLLTIDRAAIVVDALAPGTPVSVVVRPEKLRLHSARPDDAPGRIEVVVEAILFSGPHTEIVVRRNDQRINVWMHESNDIAALTVGGPAWLEVPSKDARVVPPEGRAKP